MSHEDRVGTGQGNWSYPAHLEHVRQASVTIEPISSRTSVRRRIENGVEPFRLLISGSRSIQDVDVVDEAYESLPDDWTRGPLNELVVGGADGVDSLAEDGARRRGWPIDVLTTFEADWSNGPKGGPLRNEEMVEYADALLAVWDGHSNGTRDTIDRALDHGLDVHVYVV